LAIAHTLAPRCPESNRRNLLCLPVNRVSFSFA